MDSPVTTKLMSMSLLNSTQLPSDVVYANNVLEAIILFLFQISRPSCKLKYSTYPEALQTDATSLEPSTNVRYLDTINI